MLYGLVFASIANVAFHGAWVAALAAVVVVEIADARRDQSRKLPATERVLHTLLAVNGGALFGMIAMQLAVWAHEPTAMQALRSRLARLGAEPLCRRCDDFGNPRRNRGLPDCATRAHCQSIRGQPPGNVLVTGGTGFVGETLVNHLLDAGACGHVAGAIRCARPTSFTAACAASRPSSSCSRTSVSTRSSISRGAVLGARWSAGRRCCWPAASA